MKIKATKILRCIINIILTLVAIMGIACIALRMLGIENRVVISGSMEPAIQTGSLCFIDTNADYEDIAENDIISFRADSTYVLHRAIDITEEGIETKGDNNDISDGISTTSQNFYGKYLFHIPLVGYVLYSSDLKLVSLSIIVALFIISILLDMSLDEDEEKIESNDEESDISEKTDNESSTENESN